MAQRMPATPAANSTKSGRRRFLLAGLSAGLGGAAAVAKYYQGRAQTARTALIDSAVGAVVAPNGRLLLVLRVAIANGRIADIEAVADPDRLGALTLGVLEG